MSDTARFALPLLESGQAQKELTHNEALARIDIGLHAGVEEAGLDVPPAQPSVGQCWIVGPAPTGAWIGYAGALAGWTGGGWRFLSPRDGMRVWNRAASRAVVRVGTAWEDGVVRARGILVDDVQVVGAAQPAVPAPMGGATIDAEARVAIGRILARLTAHGLLAP